MFHALDLGFHEFGHLFFGFFEQMHRTYFMHFLTVFGGSLMQWFVPFALVCYFIFTNRFYSAFFILFWLAQSFHDSVLYIESAIEMDIELLGGNNQAGHDWNYILHHLGVLYMDDQIARWILLASKALAWISVAGCVFMAIFGFVWEKEE